MLPDVGFKEIIVIGIVAIIVIKPKDWPKVLRQVGRMYGKLHDFLLQMRSYTRDTMDQITKLDVDEGPKDDDFKMTEVKDPTAPFAPKGVDVEDGHEDEGEYGDMEEFGDMNDLDDLEYDYYDPDKDEGETTKEQSAEKAPITDSESTSPESSALAKDDAKVGIEVVKDDETEMVKE
ncbi:hypothetical protein BVY04_02850 [bacterium M21]|nr:hypothetical protein BVY04_02850 [bacterium M21]